MPPAIRTAMLLTGAAIAVIVGGCGDRSTDNRLAEAADRVEIAEVLNRHQIYIDAGDTEAWASLYTSDGEYRSPFGASRGTAELAKMSSELAQSGFTAGKRHLIGPVMIDLADDDATATSYYWVAETEAYPPVIVSSGAYCDELRKVDGQWRIARRSQTIDPNWLLRDQMDVSPARLREHATTACVRTLDGSPQN